MAMSIDIRQGLQQQRTNWLAETNSGLLDLQY